MEAVFSRTTPLLPAETRVEQTAAGTLYNAHIVRTNALVEVVVCSVSTEKQHLVGEGVWPEWKLGHRHPTAVAVLDASLALALTDGSVVMGSVCSPAPHVVLAKEHRSIPAGCLKWADSGLLVAAVVPDTEEGSLVLFSMGASGAAQTTSVPLLNTPVSLVSCPTSVAVLDANSSAQLFSVGTDGFLPGAVLPWTSALHSLGGGLLLTREGADIVAHRVKGCSARRHGRLPAGVAAAVASKDGVLAVQFTEFGATLQRYAATEDGFQRVRTCTLDDVPAFARLELFSADTGTPVVAMPSAARAWTVRI